MMTHGFGKSRFESEASHMRPQLLAIALSLLPSMDDAEDAVQDTLLKLWAVRERIADTSHFRNLAVSVCRNLCLNMLRSMAVRRTDRLEEEMEVVSTDNAQHSMERQEQASVHSPLRRVPAWPLCRKAYPSWPVLRFLA